MSLVDATRDAEEGGAGQDPRKRSQIMRGASQVFLEKGFDAASMNDIARAAGVSKGTLYVYFANKEQLFVELISTEKREEVFRIVSLDFENHDVEAVLKKFRKELKDYETTKNFLKLPYDEPLPENLIRKIAEYRLRNMGDSDAFW